MERINGPGMVRIVGEPATLEQLAEESAELAQAALKLARILRMENPTPVTAAQARQELIEEWTDVYQVAMTELAIMPDFMQIVRKRKRFYDRLCEAGFWDPSLEQN